MSDEDLAGEHSKSTERGGRDVRAGCRGCFPEQLEFAPTGLALGPGELCDPESSEGHALELGGLGSRQSCTVCGEFLDSHDEDWSVQNFERHKWGGVRHPQVPYAAFDLQQFKAAAPPRPSDNDVAIFRELLRAIEAASPDTTADKLHKHLGPMLKPNKDERDILIAILGIAGILETKEHPGFLLRFIRADERHIPSRRFIDMSYPACWWRRSDGVNHEAVSYWLGQRLENG